METREHQRPSLSINTNVNRKTWKNFFHSPTVSTATIKPLSMTTKSLTTSPNESLESLSIDTTAYSQHKRTSSVDSFGIRNNCNVSTALKKKFHLPTLLSPSTISETRHFEPTPPEHIMPSLVDWSPEMPISPPPWEIDENSSASTASSPLLRNNSSGSNKSTVSTLSSHSRDLFKSTDSLSTFVGERPSFTPIRRRSSCPTMKTLSLASSSSSTLVENDNDIISITQAHTRHVSLLKRNPVVEKKPAFKKCQKVKAKAAEAAAHGETYNSNSIFSNLCDDHLKHLYIPNMFDPITREPVLRFALIKPRKYQLRRKTSWKREAKALMNWHHTLERSLHESHPVPCLPNNLPQDKVDKNFFTRRFILREFFMTEVNFWNQLFYTKVIFYDALEYTLSHSTGFAKPEDADIFCNLFDLMQFSAKLINLLRRFQINYIDNAEPTVDKPCVNIDCNNLFIGRKFVDMSEDLVVFLRCAIDYRENRKLLDASEHRVSFTRYKERLSLKKETSQFTMKDYLIIPIQRAARYVLLFKDLIKHTPADHPDYSNLMKSYHIVSSLTCAMDLAQKKTKVK